MEILLEDQVIDSVDLKAMVISRGVKIRKSVYDAYLGRVRLSRNPLECNAAILPDGTVVQLTDLSFHMEYIRAAVSWSAIKQVRYLSQIRTDFTVDLDGDGKPFLFYKGREVVELRFPPATGFYGQTTSGGIPYRGNAVLQGTQWLSFQLLWNCDFAASGQACQYCYSGGEIENLARRKRPMPRYPAPADIAEMVDYAVVKEKCADSIQITGGSMFDSEAETSRIKLILEEIDRKVGRSAIGGEILVYTTPPADPRSLDRIYEAGADRLSMSIEIWDENRARQIMPGKTRHVGRKRNLEALEYAAKRFGKGKACSNFIIGLESLESVLEGADYVASRGIVPIASVWIPFGRPVLGSMKTPDLTYYQRFKSGLSDIYCKYGLAPPGAGGLNVCMCRDVYLRGCCTP